MGGGSAAARMPEPLAQAAARAIAQSRFKPARVRGCPIASIVYQRVSFTIGQP